jgi:hypothetical protein
METPERLRDVIDSLVPTNDARIFDIDTVHAVDRRLTKDDYEECARFLAALITAHEDKHMRDLNGLLGPEWFHTFEERSADMGPAHLYVDTVSKILMTKSRRQW